MNKSGRCDFNDTMRSYYKLLKKYNPLTKEEEKEYIAKAQNGDVAARNKILEANLKFVFSIVRGYRNMGVPIGELISEGNMGMIKALEKFDNSRDVKFISYAVWWIRQAIQAYIKKSHMDNDMIKSIDEDERVDNDRDENIAMAEDKLRSVDRSDEDDDVERKRKQSELVQRLLSNLKPRQRFVIEHYYGLNCDEENLDDISEALNVSTERVRQIKITSFREMRTEVLVSGEINLF